MTEAEQLENIEVLKAYWRGEREFEYLNHDSNEWEPTGTVSCIEHTIHRRKPKPALVKWTMADVPWGCAFRRKGDDTVHYSHAAISAESIVIIGWGSIEYDLLLLEWEHPTDRIAWKPCGKLA